MGTFDDVNWQQMVPWMMGGLSAGAAYADPRSGPMLAESGWNAVRNYMVQQKMQQDQQQFQERMKAVQQELSMRQKKEDREQKMFDIGQEERLAADFMLSNMDVLNGIPEDAGVSEYYNRFNARAKEKGMGPISFGVFSKVQSSFEFMPTPTGEVGFGVGPDGNLTAVEKVKTAKGIEWRPVTSTLKISPEMLRQARESPELALGWAKGLRASGNENMAKLIEDQANRILSEKRQADFSKNYSEGLTQIKDQNKMMIDTFKLKFSEENRPVDPAQAAEWEKRRDDALRAINETTNEAIDRLNEMRAKSDPLFAKQMEEEKKRGDKDFDKSLNDHERAMYIWMLKDLHDSGVDRERAARTARATIEVQRKRKSPYAAAPQGIPGDITAPSYKPPTSSSSKPAKTASPLHIPGGQPAVRPEYPGQFSPPSSPEGPLIMFGEDEAMLNFLRAMTPRRY